MVMLKGIQVGIVADHFQCQSGRKQACGVGYVSDSTMCGMFKVPYSVCGLAQPV
jgi:hypothetical protein